MVEPSNHLRARGCPVDVSARQVTVHRASSLCTCHLSVLLGARPGKQHALALEVFLGDCDDLEMILVKGVRRSGALTCRTCPRRGLCDERRDE